MTLSQNDIEVNRIETNYYSSKAKIIVKQKLFFIFPEFDHSYSRFESIKKYFKENLLEEYGHFFRYCLEQNLDKLEIDFSNYSLENVDALMKKLKTCTLEGELSFEKYFDVTDSFLKNLKIKTSTITNSNIQNNEIKTIEDSKIINSQNLFDISGSNMEIESNLKISNLISNSSGNEKTIIQNSELENIEINSSRAKDSRIKNKDIKKINNSYIVNSQNLFDISGSNMEIESNLKISNLISSSSGNEKTIIQNSELDNLKIKNSNIVNSKLSSIEIKSSKLININNLKGDSENYCQINNSKLKNLQNSQIIRGKLIINNSIINSKNVIFYNNENETIEIKNANIKEDASFFNNAKVTNANISGNSVVYGNGEIYGINNIDESEEPHNQLQVSGYSKIFDNAKVKDKTIVSGFVNIYGEAETTDSPKIYGKINILDDARISGNAELSKEEIINKYEERFE